MFLNYDLITQILKWETKANFDWGTSSPLLDSEIVIENDIFLNRVDDIGPCVKDISMQTFFLQVSKETFDYCIICWSSFL